MNVAIEASMILLFTFALLLTLGVPIAICIATASIATILLLCPFDAAVFTTAQKMVSSLDTFSLLAVPFFVLSGVIMNNGGIALQLVNLAKLISGRIPGSLAHTNIVGNGLFGALSGSAIAASTSIGSVMVPMSVKEGYDRGFAAATNIASAPVGMITPPNSSFIIYAIVSGGTSVAALFVAGAAAGTFWSIGTMVIAYFIAKKHGYRNTISVSYQDAVKIILQAIPSLLMIVIVVGGIVIGVFSAVEASAVAVLYTFVLSFLFNRTIPISAFKSILIQTAQMTGVIMLLIAVSSAMSFAMAFTGIPTALTDLILAISDNKYVVLFIVNILLLVIGAFLDIGPAILIFTPILLPIMKSIDVDPVHFGIILIYNLCIGTITPPVGTGLFVGASVGQIKIEHVIRPLIPYYIGIITVLFLITFFPPLVMYWPQLFGL